MSGIMEERLEILHAISRTGYPLTKLDGHHPVMI